MRSIAYFDNERGLALTRVTRFAFGKLLNRCVSGVRVTLFWVASRSNRIHRGILLFPYPLGPYLGELFTINFTWEFFLDGWREGPPGRLPCGHRATFRSDAVHISPSSSRKTDGLFCCKIGSGFSWRRPSFSKGPAGGSGPQSVPNSGGPAGGSGPSLAEGGSRVSPFNFNSELKSDGPPYSHESLE
jgi:hypothetical protein